MSREDLRFDDLFIRGSESDRPIIVELTLCGDAKTIEESKLYNANEFASALSKHSKVAILRAFMLNK